MRFVLTDRIAGTRDRPLGALSAAYPALAAILLVSVPPVVLAETGSTKVWHRNVSRDQIAPFNLEPRVDSIRAELGITINQAEAWSSYEAALENYRNEVSAAHQRELRVFLRIEGNPLSPAEGFGSEFRFDESRRQAQERLRIAFERLSSVLTRQQRLKAGQLLSPAECGVQ
jgi:hypothetical protein